jgi:hypothetical protein
MYQPAPTRRAGRGFVPDTALGGGGGGGGAQDMKGALDRLCILMDRHLASAGPQASRPVPSHDSATTPGSREAAAGQNRSLD